MADPYFGGKTASMVANEQKSTPKKFVPKKPAPPKRVPLPPTLNPKGDTRFTKPPAPRTVQVRAHTRTVTPRDKNTQTVTAATKHGNTKRFYHPLHPGQKPSGYEAAGRKPGRAGIGSKVTPRPYWLATRGPGGDEASRLSSAQLVTAHRVGVRPSAGMSVLEAAAHPLTDLSRQALGTKPFDLGGAASDVANIASNFVPVGKAAGILGGLRGVKALRDAKAGAEAIGAAKAAAAPAAAQDAVRGALKGARGVRGKQEAGYSVERTKRAAAANLHLSNTNLPPGERLRLAKEELKGELPKIDFQGMKVLDEQALTKLQTHILDHPHLMPFQKIRASEALVNAASGKVPTKGELTLLEHVFGKTTAHSLGQIHAHPWKDGFLGVLNVPRSIMASFDLSAPFRQGLVVATRHPKIFAQNFKPMMKAFGSEKVYTAALDDIRARPSYPMMLEAKLALTDLTKEVGQREEQFASNIAEKLTGGKKSPIRASGRAYTGFLDKTRADVFDTLIQRAQSQGINVQDTDFLKDLGRYINSATGRGPLGSLQGAAPALNAAFFSPRLLASRLDLIFSPLTYMRADPFVRKEALRSMVQLAGTASLLLTLASQVPGVKVVLDPRNPDWGKIRLGNTRIDIGGGFQQHLRLFAQLATGTAISSTTGKRLNLTAGGFGQPNRLDLFLRFFEGKESPIASLVTDWARNSNQIGQKLDWSLNWNNPLVQRMLPLLAQDSYDLYKQKHGGLNGLAAAFAGYGIGSIGFGMQTYGQKPPKVRPAADPFGTSTSSRDPYFGQPSGGASSDPYFGTP